eukprot:scaffold17500_cov126-Isochrysis_galbana.AAC.2
MATIIRPGLFQILRPKLGECVQVVPHAVQTVEVDDRHQITYGRTKFEKYRLHSSAVPVVLITRREPHCSSNAKGTLAAARSKI